jgi:Xaa-Pro aminopeptidase
VFQTFEVTSSPAQGPARLAALRGAMAASELDGFVVPRADAHQGEYVAPCDARLEWLTGFSGSAGFCAVLPDIAGVFIDGRYRLQVASQIAQPAFTPVHWPEVKLAAWLTEHLPQGGVVGFDPWLHTVEDVATQRGALDGLGIELRPVSNLIDPLWPDRPARPRNPVRIQPDDLSGEAHGAKRARLGAALDKAGRRSAILTLPDSICWLLNIRGSDIARVPVVQAFAVLDPTGRAQLFTDAAISDEVRAHLGPDVTLHPYAGLEVYLRGCAGQTFQIDPKSAPHAIADLLDSLSAEPARSVTKVEAADPCILPKARKNAVEIAGARAAHLRDGAAMVRFLAWLDAEAPGAKLTEIAVVKALETFRVATNALQDISFETICGAGPNGAIVHYRVTDATDRAVRPGELLLVDSGGQYLDGTTDITRTVIVGAAGDDHRACYTRVLQGMIAISRVRFPKGIAGRDLDALARFALWTAGQDYDHGTGHGVGAYLSVHEGPQRISRLGEAPLEAGMILSNEPGYYRAGAFGIRIENLIAVQDAPPLAGADDRAMLAFETLTHVPFDRRLIDTALLSPAEREWIDAYHAATLDLIGPRVDGAALDWLRGACARL